MARLLSWSLFMLVATAVPMHSSAKELAVKTAVEVSYPTEPNMGYKVLRSVNLGEWDALGDQVFGGGGNFSELFPASADQAFYRIEQFPVRNLDAIMDEIRRVQNVPAVACVVVRSNKIVGIGAAGTRKWNVTNAPALATDKWYHESLTKSCTATLAAILVEEGSIKWTNTLADIFPELAGEMNAEWHSATLDHLTSNLGGAPEFPGSELWEELLNFEGTPEQARRHLLIRLTATAPLGAPGSRYQYSSVGFSLAGHMLETVAGKPWEELMKEKLFKPLGMTTGGFGVPGNRYIDHPWGHVPGAGNVPSPVLSWMNADNPPALGPGASMHCSPVDFAKYLAFHLEAHQGRSKLLSRGSALKLHMGHPNQPAYGYGWNVMNYPWGGGANVLTHTGTNLQSFSNAWLAPGREFAVLTVCNLGGATSFFTVEMIAERMVQEFLN